ncbi:hypothetical protein ES288_D06G131500v1 [Gossypium darwinii]|uniref:peroxidase n=1 Tax=Gossypium darwinii TaxID=34276 RepID=A0A5D2C616_GOSDA|nr:hypothetical protein ES288_D06G131500v1 [Gossypium darwinii]
MASSFPSVMDPYNSSNTLHYICSKSHLFPPTLLSFLTHSFKLGYQRMAISLQCFLVLICISIFSSTIAATDPPLTLDYYKSTCPNVFDIVKKEMECHVLSDPRNAAFILRLHFHDCFVQGTRIYLRVSYPDSADSSRR